MSTQATIYGVISHLEKYPVEEAKTMLFRMVQDMESKHEQHILSKQSVSQEVLEAGDAMRAELASTYYDPSVPRKKFVDAKCIAWDLAKSTMTSTNNTTEA